MSSLNLDIDILRTLVLAERLGGFGRAAEQVGRSQSAVSQQLRRLEDQVGEPLFRKSGRGLVPTAAGEVLLSYARRILDLNDEAVFALRGHAVAGEVRLGLPADFAEVWLPEALGRFGRAHPTVRITATVDRNRLLLERLDQGELDLALTLNQGGRSDSRLIAALPAVWIGVANRPSPQADDPVSLVVADAPCFFRQRAIEALDRAGRSWTIAVVSPSLGGIWAAVEAGLGVTLRTTAGLPPSLVPLSDLPAPSQPHMTLTLNDGGRTLSPAATRLADIVVGVLQERLDRGLSLAA
ncbi:LysR substrate-binding domain-containing protein [soil metagenome]